MNCSLSPVVTTYFIYFEPKNHISSSITFPRKWRSKIGCYVQNFYWDGQLPPYFNSKRKYDCTFLEITSRPIDAIFIPHNLYIYLDGSQWWFLKFWPKSQNMIFWNCRQICDVIFLKKSKYQFWTFFGG